MSFFKIFFENRRFRHPRSSGGVPGAPGGIADWIIRVPGLSSGLFNASVWDGQGVEVEARQFLTFRHGMSC